MAGRTARRARRRDSLSEPVSSQELLDCREDRERLSSTEATVSTTSYGVQLARHTGAFERLV